MAKIFDIKLIKFILVGVANTRIPSGKRHLNLH
ncbi:Uncharacterised protein [uncultured Clostridium sp.]|nr:Uncharacterised protein [uncultured Clostridium sp.]